MLTRRHVFFTGAAGLAALVLGRITWPHAAKAAKTYEVTHTDAEWQKMLSPEAYEVLRHEGTERPFTSPLNNEHRAGTFACAGCELPLYSSSTKFDSGTGWPSFWAPLDNAVDETSDRTSSWSAPKCIAAAAAAISAMYSTTAPSRRDCATA